MKNSSPRNGGVMLRNGLSMWVLFIAVCIQFTTLVSGIRPPRTHGLRAVTGHRKHCEPLTMSMCLDESDIKYNWTVFPNRIGHRRQSEAAIHIREWSRPIYVSCSDILRTFICMAFAPQCGPNGERLDPCQSLCRLAEKGCIPLLRLYGKSWPIYLSCDSFPEDGKETCMGKNSEVIRPGSGNTQITDNVYPPVQGCTTGIDIEDEFSGVQFHRSFAGSRVAIGKITTNNVYPHNLTFDFRTRSSESQLLMLLTNRKPHHDDFIPRHSRGSNIPDFFAIYISNWGFPRITCSFRCGRMSGVMVHYQRLDKNNWHKVTFNAETSYVSYDEYSNALQCGMPDVCREDLKYMYMGGMPERFLPKSLLKEMLPARTLRGCIRKLRFNGRQQSVSARYIAVSSCC